MEIVVLLKQVPATESYIGIAGDGKHVKTEDVKWVINPYDEFAVEEALRIRDAHKGAVTVLSVGGDKTVEAIRTALAMGADKGVLVNDPGAQSCDALGIARILSAVLKTISFDLIIAGMRAVDDDNYQVGTAVAEFLGIPNIPMVTRQEISNGRIRCHRTVEGGSMIVETALPMLFTCQRGLNEPRYASLPGIMKAKKKPIDKKSLSDIGIDPASLIPLTAIVALTPPPDRKGGRMIEGEDVNAKASALVKALREEAKVL
jgi:electron transfer flavoprotein beta subunit